MDKVIRVIQGANGILTCGKKYSPNWTLDQTIREEGRKGERKGKKERRRKLSERSSTFSLVFKTIGPAVPGGSRRKVLSGAKSFQ